MKTKLILLIALFIGTHIPLSAQGKTEKTDSYLIIKRNGGPFGFRFIEYNKGINNTGGIHHNLICEGWGFNSSKIPFIKKSDDLQSYEELTGNAVIDILNFCITNHDKNKCKGDYSAKIILPTLNDTTKRQCRTIKIKWKIEDENCDDEKYITSEKTETDE